MGDRFALSDGGEQTRERQEEAHARAGEQTQAEGRRGDYGRRGGARAAAAARRARDAVRGGAGRSPGPPAEAPRPTGRGGRGALPVPEDAGVVPESQAVAQKEVFYTEGSAELAAARAAIAAFSMPRAAARLKRLRAARDTASAPEDPEGAEAALAALDADARRAAFLETDASVVGDERPRVRRALSRAGRRRADPLRVVDGRGRGCGAPSGASVCSPCARRRALDRRGSAPARGHGGGAARRSRTQTLLRRRRSWRPRPRTASRACGARPGSRCARCAGTSGGAGACRFSLRARTSPPPASTRPGACGTARRARSSCARKGTAARCMMCASPGRQPGVLGGPRGARPGLGRAIGRQRLEPARTRERRVVRVSRRTARTSLPVRRTTP